MHEFFKPNFNLLAVILPCNMPAMVHDLPRLFPDEEIKLDIIRKLQEAAIEFQRQCLINNVKEGELVFDPGVLVLQMKITFNIKFKRD